MRQSIVRPFRRRGHRPAIGLVVFALAALSWIGPVIAQGEPIYSQFGRCLDVAGGVNANGTNVQLFDCNGSASQQWSQERIGGTLGVVQIRNAMGRCLDIAGGAAGNRTNVQIFDCNGSLAQQWLMPSVEIISMLNSRCLDVAGGVNANRTNVHMFDCNNTTAQLWSFGTAWPAGPATPPPGAGPNADLPPTASTTLVGGFRDHDAALYAGGPAIMAALGGNCVGYTTFAPAYSINYRVGFVPNRYPLGFGFISDDDTTLAILTPGGRWICNNDAGADVRNPFVQIPDPEQGYYLVWIGTVENLYAQRIVPGGTLWVIEQ